MELISILMPTYNVVAYIDEAVNSILAQTYTNFELIIVDDCSTDGTYERLLTLAKSDSRIRLYRNECNSKICKTLNRALSFAQGEYIARMDGDDISLPNRLEHLKKYLDENPKCDLVGSPTISIDVNGNELSRRRAMMTWPYISRYMKYLPCILHIWLAKRYVYEQLNGYREIPYAEDYDFLLRGMRMGYQYANIKEFDYKVRIRDGNTLSTNGLKQQKARKLVQWLYKEERKGKKELLTLERYEQSMKCSKKEEQSFSRASEHLNNALHSRNNKVKMIFEIVMAILGSWYIFDSLYASAMLRLGNKLESKKLEKIGR